MSCKGPGAGDGTNGGVKATETATAAPEGRPAASSVAFLLCCTAVAGLIGYSAGGGFDTATAAKAAAEPAPSHQNSVPKPVTALLDAVRSEYEGRLASLVAEQRRLKNDLEVLASSAASGDGTELADLREDYEDRLAALRAEQRALKTKLEDTAGSEPQGDAAAGGTLDRIRSGYEDRLAGMKVQQRRLVDRIEIAESNRASLEVAYEEASAELDRLKLAAARKDGAVVGTMEALSEAQSTMSRLRLSLAEAEAERDGLARTLSTLASTMETVIAERDIATQKAAALDAEIASLAEKQEETLQRLEDATRLGLSGMRGVLEKSGLNIERVLDETRRDFTGEGGPFEALADDLSDAGMGEQAELRVAALMDNLEELNLMRFAAKRMPFGHPVKGARRTSGFGPRRDPFGRGRAMHKGLDFAGPKNSKIYATADGVVTFSGAQRGYGRIVIIRHAFGVETRYAHLNRSHVKVGERVERGDHIADMGSTGRSTGVHLHYEIRVDREAVNPAQFLRAETDVL